jgi:ABC-type bacteriocin/lantibiotic exporter with double-glycine peptidase domain
VIIEFKYLPYSLWENEILSKLFVRCYTKSIKSEFDYFNKNNAGTISSKINMAVIGFKNFSFDSLFYFFPLFIELIFSCSSVFLILNNSNIALIMFLGFTAYSALVILFSNRLTKQQNITRDINLSLTHTLSDIFESWKDIKLCSGFNATEKIVHEKSKHLAKEIQGVYNTRFIIGIFQSIVLVLTIVLVNYLIIKSMISGENSIGSIFLINSYMYQIMKPLEALGINYRNLNRSYNDFILFESEIDNVSVKEDFQTQIENIHSISLKNVTKNDIFKNVNLKISKGESICIIGKSGVGKTTLLNIIANIDKNYEGNVYYNDTDVSKLTWINNFPYAYLSSGARLLSQSTITNISLSDTCMDYNSKEALNSAWMIDEHILRNPDLYNTRYLSSGERQRILLARTLHMRTTVRIFDESMSALDHISQELLTEAIINDGKNYINIFVTHNEILAKKFDRILRIADGIVSEERKQHLFTCNEGVLENV